jgi:3-oxoacyl-[acyl-carrier protein] reductase
MINDFSRRVAVVTGATRGIGRAISLAFLKLGATVIGVYGSDQAAAESLRAESGFGEEVLRLKQCDVADYAAVNRLFAEIEADFETIDILVNNAGIRRDGVVAMLKHDDWQRVLDVNLTGSYNMAKEAVLLMLKQKYGRIIFITSPMSRLGFAGQANYAASKAGQLGLMHALAKETARRKITVNCVSPGFIETDLIASLPPEQLAEYKKMVPMRRFGRPEEVADAVCFLAGEQAAYITDSVLEVAGGI